MNNRTQQINSFLDSITQKELDDYIKERKLNNEMYEMFEQVKRNRKVTHFERLSNSVNKDFQDIISNNVKLGEAWIIAFVLVCFYDDKYKISDLKLYMKKLIDDDNTLKQYVYDLMKDF